MNLADEIRQQIEKCKDLKLDIGEINNHLSTLENLVRKDIMEQVDEAYQKGYDKGYADKTNNDEVCKQIAKDIQDEAYQRGLNDAWEAARKIITWPDRSLVNSDAFDLDPGENIFTKYSASEAIERLKSYEDDKIKRGDIVNVKGSCKDDLLGVVTKVWKDNCYIMWDDGSGGTWSKDSVVKTGKHIDVDKFLEEIAT